MERDATRSGLSFAGPDDGPAIAELLAEPLPGAIGLVLGERAHLLAPHINAHCRHQAMILRDSQGRVQAHGARTVRRLLINGQPQWVGYLHGLRQRAGILTSDGRRLGRGLSRLCQARAADEADHDFTSILATNARAQRVLGGRIPGAPPYRWLADYRTTIIDRRHARRWHGRGVQVTAARSSDLPQLSHWRMAHAAAYSPAWDDETAGWWLAWRERQLVGALRIIDRRGERCERLSYSRRVTRWRPLLNPLLRLARRLPLPADGGALDAIYAAGLSVPGDDPRALRALLGTVAREYNAAAIILGLGRNHALSPVVDALPAWRIDSLLFRVGGIAQEPDPSASPEAAWL